MSAPIANARVYGDFAGLEALKKAARSDDPAAIRQVAKQFEGLFARMMIKSMRDAIGKDPIFGSDQEQTYQQMYDDQLSLELTKGHGLGLADMLVRQLQRKGVAGAAGGAPGNGTASKTGSTGAAGVAGPRAFSLAPPHHALPAPSKAVRQTFIHALLPHAKQAARELGVAPEGLLAQAALETNWGRDVPQGGAGASSNNLFGIKADGGWDGPTVSAVTHEFAGGAVRAAAAHFRAYGDPGESFKDYVAMLKGNPRYAGALGTGGNVGAFANALQRGGYATDPDYARKVSAVASEVTSALADPNVSAGPLAASEAPLKSASAPPITNGGDSLR